MFLFFILNKVWFKNRRAKYRKKQVPGSGPECAFKNNNGKNVPSHNNSPHQQLHHHHHHGVYGQSIMNGYPGTLADKNDLISINSYHSALEQAASKLSPLNKNLHINTASANGQLDMSISSPTSTRSSSTTSASLSPSSRSSKGDHQLYEESNGTANHGKSDSTTIGAHDLTKARTKTSSSKKHFKKTTHDEYSNESTEENIDV